VSELERKRNIMLSLGIRLPDHILDNMFLLKDQNGNEVISFKATFIGNAKVRQLTIL
jgi:hypothetical protein